MGFALKTVEPDSLVPDADRIPDTIGPYRILGKLGEGGMAVVYLAQQTRPLRQRVAIKVLKPGLETHALLARFEIERQALALMDHPGIARVIDAGQTIAGRPFFVMERVQGEPITTFCRDRSLSLEKRIELFASVCRAVHHAHRKGIIHRDLKPSNVLVTLLDDIPAPKIIDFGVAKAMVGDLTEQTLFTRQGDLIGTPAYMSPEQAEGRVFEIDSRADVYSLGAVLYELLTGAPPFDPHQLRVAGYTEILRVLREVEPARPSVLARRLERGGAVPGMPRNVAKQLRGDLDWIVMKAMEKDRLHRYADVVELLADLERYLAHQEVSAGPPSLSRRLRQVARRRFSAATRIMVLLVLFLGIVVPLALRETSTPTPVPARTLPIPHGPGNAGSPAISPDGRFVAYISDASGNWELWKINLESAERTRLTSSAEKEDWPAWSPDGRRLSFTRSRQAGGGEDIYVMPSSGSPPQLVTEHGSEPSWSPDGQWLVYSESRGSRLVKVRLEDSSRIVPLTESSPGFFQRRPTWSPDGETIVYNLGPGGIKAQLMRVSSNGGSGVPVLHDERGVTSLSPVITPDGRFVIHVSDRGGAMNLWRVPIDGGRPERLTSAGERHLRPTISADGSTVAFGVDRAQAKLVRIGLDDDTETTVATLGEGYAWGVSLSADGSQVAVCRRPPGRNWYLAVVSMDGGSDRTVLELPEFSLLWPSFHPDGRSLVFYAQGDVHRIGRVGLDGNGLRWLTGEDEVASYPALSHDGKLLAFTRTVADSVEIVIRQLHGGIDRAIVEGETPAFSPDDTMVAFAGDRSYLGGIGVVNLATGEIHRLTDRGSWPVWMPDGRSIAYMTQATHGRLRAEVVPLDGGEAATLTDYPFLYNTQFVVGPESRGLITTIASAEPTSIWLAEF